MLENVGPYLSYGELLFELSLGESGVVTSSDISLSNKTADPGGDIYEFSGAAPQVGDAIYQSAKSDCIIEILSGPDRLRVAGTGALNPIVEGVAKLLHSDDVPKSRGEELILEAMEEFDEATRQFFHKRHLVFSVEGMNSNYLHFGVPIIKIDRIVINNTDIELIEGDDNDFVVFNGREPPQDDRKNPRIKLNLARHENIFQQIRGGRIFRSDVRTLIEGDFGYLDRDGNTPSGVKTAIKRRVIKRIGVPHATGAVSPSTGGVRRVKVDLHEKEFFELRGINRGFQLTDDQEYNMAVARFMAPKLITSSIREVSLSDIA